LYRPLSISLISNCTKKQDKKERGKANWDERKHGKREEKLLCTLTAAILVELICSDWKNQLQD
jgi:hypothetical protein